MKQQTKSIFSGELYGRLITLHELPYNKKERVWRCRCECGSYNDVKVSHLRQGSTKSCGCLSKDLSRVRLQKSPDFVNSNRLFNSYRKSAKERGIPWSLTYEECYKLFINPCSYCGIESSCKIGIHKNKNDAERLEDFRYNGIDRKDNLLGYTEENSVSCCKNCNMAKRNLPYTEWESWLERIVQFRTEREKK